VRLREQDMEESLRKYSNHPCVLIKKRRCLFRYIWVIECEDKTFRVNVGKKLYHHENEGAVLVLVRKKRKLISIKRGFSEV